MTLLDLYEAIAPNFPEYGRKDLKTAIKVLAQALGYNDAGRCPTVALEHPLPELYQLVEAHLIAHGKKVHTIKNTKNNLSRLVRLTRQAGLLEPAETPSPATQLPHRQRRFGRRRDHPRYVHRLIGSYLVYRDWPDDLKRAFAAFEHWAKAPFIPGRDQRWRKRPVTIHSYRNCFESYFGYLWQERRIRPLQFEHLFDIDLIRDYIHWYVNEHHGQPTVSMKTFIKHLCTLTHQYRPMPELRAQLKALNRDLGQPSPSHDKAEGWVSMDTLGAIGRALWPAKSLHALHSDGSWYARNAGLSLVFQLWTFIPYRSRNICEMMLGDNLHRKDGPWRITFAGEELKVARKNGKTNVYDLPFPSDLVPILEEYLGVWRPILAAKTQHRFPQVFLGRVGRPYPQPYFHHAATDIVHGETGKPWHPHLVRTVWATEWIRDKKPGDFYNAAVMLNDTLQTVINRYSHLLGDGIAEQVYERLSQHQTKAAFSAEAKLLLAALAEKLEINQSAVLELLNRSSR